MRCGESPPDDIYVFIEVPRGSNIKCEYDENLGILKIDRVLHTSSFYPFNYGFIPETLEEDGDPIDCLVISYDSYPHGVLVRAVPVGVLITEDEHGVDRKVLAVPHPEVDPRFREVRNLNDLSGVILEQIKHFFQHYKELESNKWVKIIGMEDAEFARKIIGDAISKYRARVG